MPSSPEDMDDAPRFQKQAKKAKATSGATRMSRGVEAVVGSAGGIRTILAALWGGANARGK
jgi:hypothetical protein